MIVRAKKPEADSLIMHEFYRGKMQTMPRCVIRDINDFSIWYTPGVAAPCRAIQHDTDKVYDYTSKWNTIAVISDGTRVLGLGNIGPEAAMPVMEGKALLFKYLGGVDAIPICLDTRDPEEVIKTVKYLQPSFGGINMEDFESPKCFSILDTLRKECRIPVWHDDQQGTATITLAGLINALKIVGKDKRKARVTMIGAGAANVAIARLLFADGFLPENIIFVDSHGTIYDGRPDLNGADDENSYKISLARQTNPYKIKGSIPEALNGADICLALSRSGPGTIKPEWLRGMADDGIGFFCANPIPEIWPWDAREAGLRLIATGRSDFSNQVNNSICFPAIFRGALDVKAMTITDEMCIAGAYEIAKYAEERGMNESSILPTMADWEVYVRVAVAVGFKAIEQGVARENVNKETLKMKAENIITLARKSIVNLMKSDIIPRAPI